VLYQSPIGKRGRAARVRSGKPLRYYFSSAQDLYPQHDAVSSIVFGESFHSMTFQGSTRRRFTVASFCAAFFLSDAFLQLFEHIKQPLLDKGQNLLSFLGSGSPCHGLIHRVHQLQEYWVQHCICASSGLLSSSVAVGTSWVGGDIAALVTTTALPLGSTAASSSSSTSSFGMLSTGTMSSPITRQKLLSATTSRPLLKSTTSCTRYMTAFVCWR
jgi:hypothetical protein